MEQFIRDVCKKENISIKELRAGSHRRRVSLVRLQIASQLLGVYGTPLAEIARSLGVTTSAISKALKKEPEQ
ncbi:MAG: hypothetical protein ACE5NJ_05275, partial [Thermodesulfobacteriota bacterium]